MITAIHTRTSLPLSETAEFSLPPDVIFVIAHDGSARLLNMAGGFHAVPAVGTLMLQETLAHGAAAAVKRIAGHYGVEPRQVQHDLEVFLRQLEAHGLLCDQRKCRRTSLGRMGLARLVLRPALATIERTFRSSESKAQALLALARVSFALFGWTRTLAVWKEAYARCNCRQAGERDEQTVRAVDQAVRAAAARHFLQVECKERALCCWALARSAGLDAALVVGIDLFPLAGHCWCEVGPLTLGDNVERCLDYTPIGRW